MKTRQKSQTVKKPKGCEGCPLYHDGWGYVNDTIPKGVKVLIVRDIPSDKSRLSGKAGTSGESWHIREHQAPAMGLDGTREVGFAHILRCRPHNGKDFVSTPPKAEKTNPAIAQCRQYDPSHLLGENGVKVLVANGPLAWKVLSDGVGTMGVWRGFYVERNKDDG